MEEIKKIFREKMGVDVQHIKILPASGSSRKNFVIESSKGRFVITQNENISENKSFIYFSKVFSQLNLNTPKILGEDTTGKVYIQEFLGEHTLSEIIFQEKETKRVEALVDKTLDALYRLQQKTKNQIDYTHTFEYTTYDRLPILHDCHYFKFLLIDVLEIPYRKADLLREFEELAKEIENITPRGFMIRDFQARNILVNEHDAVFFIDYQAAMYGPLLYDVVSFLYQIKANFSEKFIEKKLIYYIQKFQKHEQKQLWDALPYIRFIRNLQILGAYGFRGIIQQKKHFIESLPTGIKNIANTFQLLPEQEKFPELKKVIESLQIKKINCE